MKALAAVMFCWVVFAADPAFADANVEPRTLSRTGHPAKGSHSKASSFAPHARSKNHAYGTPIQGKILTSRAPRVKSAPLPAPIAARRSPTSP
jgi:hypothetical protein